MFVAEKLGTGTRKGAGMSRNHFSEAVQHARCAVVRTEDCPYEGDICSVLGELAKAITDLAEGLAEQDRFFPLERQDHKT